MISKPGEVLHVIVPVDGSEHAQAALHWTTLLAAGQARLRCTLLNVQRPVMSGEVGLLAPASIAEGARQRSAADILEQAAALLHAHGIPYALETRMDDAATAIVERATALGCDAIVMGRRGIGVVRSTLLGSVSTEVVQRSSLPIVMVGPLAPAIARPPLRSMVAVDGSDGALRATRFAARVAGVCGGTVVLLHVEPGVRLAGPPAAPDEAISRQERDKQAQAAMAAARNVVEAARVSCIEQVAIGADIAHTIVAAARENACDLIAMGTRGLGPLTGLLAGSVAQGVLKEAATAGVPVVLVR